MSVFWAKLISDDYEKKKIINVLQNLRTPRDELYKIEIRKLEDKYTLLVLEHEAALKSIESFQNIKLKMDKYEEIDLKELITNELVNIRALKDTYESHIMARHSSSISELKKLAIEYKEMTIHFKKLDKLLSLSFDAAEMQETVLIGVKESLEEIKGSVKKLVTSGSQGLTKLIEKIVSHPVFLRGKRVPMLTYLAFRVYRKRAGCCFSDLQLVDKC